MILSGNVILSERGGTVTAQLDNLAACCPGMLEMSLHPLHLGLLFTQLIYSESISMLLGRTTLGVLWSRMPSGLDPPSSAEMSLHLVFGRRQ